MLTGSGNQYVNPDYLRPLSPLPSEVRPRRVYTKKIHESLSFSNFIFFNKISQTSLAQNY